MIGACSNYRRTRRYKLLIATMLDTLVRNEPETPTYLVLHEFDGEELPMAELARCDETVERSRY